MSRNFSKQAGAALIISTLLLTVTMVLHPAGGSFAQLARMTTFILVTHSLALLAIPVCLFGFWGLANHFKKEQGLSRLAFVVMSVSLFAALCAAGINGLALPFFVQRYADADAQVIESIKPILRYNGALNQAFDLIFIVGSCVAMVLWSVALLRRQELPRWLGVYGLLLGASLLVALLSGFVMVDLHGFRLFIFAVVSWIFLTGLYLRKAAEDALP